MMSASYHKPDGRGRGGREQERRERGPSVRPCARAPAAMDNVIKATRNLNISSLSSTISRYINKENNTEIGSERAFFVFQRIW